MSKYINADEFMKKYNEIDLTPYMRNGYAQQVDGYEMWEKWKKEFDRTVRRILSQLSYIQENEDVIIGKIKEIPLIPISLPSADVVEVKHATWKYSTFAECYMCTNCRYDDTRQHRDSLWKFCPNCGADMRERETDNDT